MTSKEYVEKYSWLKITEDDEDDNVFCAIDYIPCGWREAFGEQFCEDLDNVIKKHGLENEFSIDEIKEKYGQLRVYFHPVNEDLYNVIRTYEAISETVCMFCGEIKDIRFVNWGWMHPSCDKCFKIINNGTNIDRFEALEMEKLPTVVKWTRYGKDGTTNHEMDINNTTLKIIERYDIRVANGDIDNTRKEMVGK